MVSQKNIQNNAMEKYEMYMTKKAMEPFGLALESFYNGNEEAKIIYRRDDGQSTEDSIKGYFRTYSDFSEREKIAINQCKGKILDVGAGVGPHSLELQKEGFNVTAIDISDKACKIMRQRGVKNVLCATAFELIDEDFDTILILGCSIGFVEDLKGLRKFLSHAKSLLKPNGIILLDSRDVRVTDKLMHLQYQQDNMDLGKYRGEIRLRIEFQSYVGEPFQILHIDPDTLKEVANESNWNCEILHKENSGLYLAKLS